MNFSPENQEHFKHDVLNLIHVTNKDVRPEYFADLLSDHGCNVPHWKIMATIKFLIFEGLLIYDEDQNTILGLSDKGFVDLGMGRFNKKANEIKADRVKMLMDKTSLLLSIVAILLSVILFCCERMGSKTYKGTYGGKMFQVLEI